MVWLLLGIPAALAGAWLALAYYRTRIMDPNDYLRLRFRQFMPLGTRMLTAEVPYLLPECATALLYLSSDDLLRLGGALYGVENATMILSSNEGLSEGEQSARVEALLKEALPDISRDIIAMVSHFRHVTRVRLPEALRSVAEAKRRFVGF